MPVIMNPPPETAPVRREQPEYVPPPLDPAAKPLFSVIMPAYNEQATMGEAVQSLVSVMTEYGEPFEILIVDDGSRDETAKIASAIAAANPFVKLLRHDRNRGLGAAIRTAVAAARGDYVVGSPVDSPLDGDQLRAFHDTIEARASYSYFPGKAACDVAVGFREQRAGYKWWMSVCSWIYRMMLRASFRMWLRDFNWICMYRRSIFERVAIEFDGFAALPEILVKAKRAGFRLRQVPCPMKARKVGRGTVGRPKILFKATADFFRLWAKLTFSSSAPPPKEAEKQA